jgi:hypothetical protein
MKIKKPNNTDRKYDKPVSLYPLTPEEALAAFMKVDPKKIRKGRKGSTKESKERGRS